ncbi:MAG: 16S rRNA methyltransferase, partial [Treponema sp.]|nr:16S rRNA methyltransferase [Treponema sp.]
MNICLFKPEEIAKPLDIKDERAVHLLKILHKGEGDSFAAGIIGGKAGRATITRLDLHEEKSADGRKSFKKGSISFDFVGESDGKPLYPLKMIVGFPRPIQLKRL